MSKRSREEEVDAVFLHDSPNKRVKTSTVDYISHLSDELLLKVLSHLPVSQLIVCQRVSPKLRRLAEDGQLWKRCYYDRFVRPRASRIPGLKDAGSMESKLHFASKTSAWLNEEHLVKEGANTDWKRQYKLRHKWSKGCCAVNEIPVAQQAPVPPILVQMQDGVVYTADPTAGLRAWSAKGDRRLIASIAFSSSDDGHSQIKSPPTSLAISLRDANGYSAVLVGFEDGSFNMFSLDHIKSCFVNRYTHKSPSLGVLTAVAVNWPFVMTMTATQHLSLYRFSGEISVTDEDESLPEPRLLHSLKSDTIWPPLSLSLRVSASFVLVCVAYGLPTYLSGWTVGIQEIKLTRDGAVLSSRTASAIDQHYRPLTFYGRHSIPHLVPFTTGMQTSLSTELRHIHAKPTSLSYTHPYLLVSHPDNTLTLYLVTSNLDTLSISAGSRLWGHTSSVSGAHIGGRGKAVSVSRRGDELRIWELEGGFVSSTARKRLAAGDLSVQIRPESSRQSMTAEQKQSGLDLVQNVGSSVAEGSVDVTSGLNTDEASELTLTRGWIGFDDESVVFLKEESQGNQALVVYDFT